MQHARIIIIGAGLSGLYAAHLLERLGVANVVVLEARDFIGGRIAGMQAAGGSDRFDLGPAWFWPEQQCALHQLVDGLGLQRFAQYDQGDMLYQRAAGRRRCACARTRARRHRCA